MTDVPSTPPDPGPDDSGLPPELAKFLADLTGGEVDPRIAEVLNQFGVEKIDPGALAAAAGQLRSLFTGGGTSGIDEEQALTIARGVVGSSESPEVSDAEAKAVVGAVRVAGLWLAEATDLAVSAPFANAWTRSEWAEETMPLWRELVTPVSDGMTAAITSAIGSQLGNLDSDSLPPGLLPPGIDPAVIQQMSGQLGPIMSRMSGAMFSVQLGQAVGALSGEVLTGNEVGLPLVPDGRVVLLPAAIAVFADGLQIDLDEVRLHLAVRESARTALFGAVPWVGPQVMAAVRDYGRDITFDVAAIEATMRDIDPSDPEALQQALSGTMFAPTPSPAQEAALVRLETSLALIEGWVDVVTAAACDKHLPRADALGEATRRRRAGGGPAEVTFRGLVGLDLRPRRLRDAANLWRALEAALGPAGRDKAWRHPDLAPTAADLDDPLGYVERLQHPDADAMDDELAALLDETGTDSGSDAADPT